MSVFMSFYTMVDGLFVSNLIGTSALSAINLTAPVIQVVTAISTMLATGGSAVIMKKMGEQKQKEAREDFTFLILVNVVVGLVMTVLGYSLMETIFGSMGLSPEVAGYCTSYLSRYLLFTIPILLMNNFALYMIASEKATLSLICSVTGGVLNIVLDYVFIGLLDMGIRRCGHRHGPGLLCDCRCRSGCVRKQTKPPSLYKARFPIKGSCKCSYKRMLRNGDHFGHGNHYNDDQWGHALLCW